MAKLIRGSETLNAIESIFRDDREVLAAVAYWNGGAAEKLVGYAGQRLRVVLDVDSGGTSAKELQYLMDNLGPNVRVHRDFHAKIYASPTRALVGSANASNPGLHLSMTQRVEASLLVEGEPAQDAYDYAQELFDKAEPATSAHLKICKERFGRNSLGNSEAPEGRVDILTALWSRAELLAEMPLIITKGLVDPNIDRKEWSRSIEELSASDEAVSGLKRSEWDGYNWRLSSGYYDQTSIALHLDGKSIYGSVVVPHRTSSTEMTFAKFLPPNVVDCLTGRAAKPVRLKGNTERLNELRSAIKRLINEDRLLKVKDLALD